MSDDVTRWVSLRSTHPTGCQLIFPHDRKMLVNPAMAGLSQRDAANARSFERKLIPIIALLVCTTWLLGCSLISSDEDKVLDDLNLMSEGKTSTGFISSYDYICFASNGNPKKELLEESSRIGFPGNPIDCDSSDSSIALIGLVKNNQIHCIENIKFHYWMRESPVCFKPGKMQVVKLKSAPLATDFGGSRQFNRNVPTFQIMEK